MTDIEEVIEQVEELIAPEPLYPWQRELLRHLLEHPDAKLVSLLPRRG
jgi:hypothetical protein